MLVWFAIKKEWKTVSTPIALKAGELSEVFIQGLVILISSLAEWEKYFIWKNISKNCISTSGEKKTLNPPNSTKSGFFSLAF